MRIYTTAIFLVAIFILVSTAFAQSTVTENAIVVTSGKNITAGMTPDNFLYGLDTSIDQLRLLLTFDSKAKAKLGLEIARERLLEVREMIAQNKIDAATRAQQEHVGTLETVSASAAAITKANATEEVEDEVEVERELEEHEGEVEEVGNELKVKIVIRGTVTDEQRNLIDAVLSRMQNKTGEVKIKIDAKKEETKIKIRQVTGLNETEVERVVKRIEVREKLFEVRSQKALEKISDASEKISEVRLKMAELNATINLAAVNILLNQADLHLVRSENAFNETKFGEAFGQATSASSLARNAGRILDKLLEREEKAEIEVETKEEVSEVKVKVADKEFEFKTRTTNREEIISEIVERTGLGRDEVVKILKIRAEKIKPEIVERLENVVERKKIEIEKKEEREVRTKGCKLDADCVREIACPQVVGSDTPVCRNNVCTCGSKATEKSVRPTTTESKRVGIESKKD